jgi:hypothetical protein
MIWGNDLYPISLTEIVMAAILMLTGILVIGIRVGEFSALLQGME